MARYTRTMLIAFAVVAAAETAHAAYYHVEANCSKPPEDYAELISENPDGERERVRVWFEEDYVSKIVVGSAEPGKPYEDEVMPDIEDAGSPAGERNILYLGQLLEPFHRACHGDIEQRLKTATMLREGKAGLAEEKLERLKKKK